MKAYDGGWQECPAHNFEKHCEYLALANEFHDTPFKSDGKYCCVVGNDTRDIECAKKYFYYIKENHQELLSNNTLEKFLRNDTYGSPFIHELDGIKISPGTLIYMKHLADVMELKDIKSIVEIGSGYGGLCKIVTDYMDVDYTCVDLPGCLKLCKTYLNKLGVKANFMESTDVEESYPDLVMSCSALSELDSDGIDFYFENIIKNSKNVYITLGNFNPYRQGNHKRIMENLDRYFDLVTVDKCEINKENPRSVIIRGNKK